jgi:hypothetical protein
VWAIGARVHALAGEKLAACFASRAEGEGEKKEKRAGERKGGGRGLGIFFFFLKLFSNSLFKL